MARDDGDPASAGPMQIVLDGPFAVTGPDGSDLTPRPHKARALMALLALAPDGRRSRRWLEERLWSDRAPAQAAGSLRQALMDLRRALGPCAPRVQADRDWIVIDLAGLRIAPAPPGAEFLEGIAVRDPAFLRWRDTQARDRARPDAAAALRAPATPEAPPQPILIRAGSPNAAGTGAAVVAEILGTRIAQDITDRISAATIAPQAGGAAPDLDISCMVVEDNGICLALIKVIHPATGRIVFAQDFRFAGTPASLAASEAVTAAAWQAAERTVGRLPHILGLGRAESRAAALGQLALHRMFSFDAGQLDQADSLMEQAWQVEENPVHLAWRGLLQMVRAIELPQAMRPELHDLAQQLTAQAMDRDTGNATVKALVAQTRAMLWGEAEGAGLAAARAIEENPRNPLALQAMAVARMLAGDGEAAYRLSLTGRAHAARSEFRHWWDAHHATVCIATGRLDEAARAAEAAAFGAPSLRPAYRYLMSLYALRGDLDRAQAMRERLEALEPGFSLDRMLHDPDYPVRTLRQTGLLGQVRKLL
ncbi:MAG TPA: hypothetical protein VLA78_09850 [Paracoccaceae bacterium]|nr:hypothetical protein [Paracoccaceae bacterium]